MTKPSKQHKKVRQTIRLAKDLDDFYKQLAAENGQHFITGVEWALRLYMNEHLTTKRK